MGRQSFIGLSSINKANRMLAWALERRLKKIDK
jgi:hypothetical protein